MGEKGGRGEGGGGAAPSVSQQLASRGVSGPLGQQRLPSAASRSVKVLSLRWTGLDWSADSKRRTYAVDKYTYLHTYGTNTRTHVHTEHTQTHAPKHAHVHTKTQMTPPPTHSPPPLHTKPMQERVRKCATCLPCLSERGARANASPGATAGKSHPF